MVQTFLIRWDLRSHTRDCKNYFFEYIAKDIAKHPAIMPKAVGSLFSNEKKYTNTVSKIDRAIRKYFIKEFI
jgi:hypothetical protein